MNLNLLNNLKENMKSSFSIENFMKEISNRLNNKEENNMDINRKEGHLYLVTEDRGNEVYLWDYTEKAKTEFKEIIDSKELQEVAKEGAMLQYKNGKYELYSLYGFDIVNENVEK